jgi:hypothetical protein
MFNIICKKIKKNINIKPKHFLILKEHSTGESDDELSAEKPVLLQQRSSIPLGVPRLISKVPSRVCVYRKCGSCKLFLFVIFVIFFSYYTSRGIKVLNASFPPFFVSFIFLRMR